MRYYLTIMRHLSASYIKSTSIVHPTIFGRSRPLQDRAQIEDEMIHTYATICAQHYMKQKWISLYSELMYCWLARASVDQVWSILRVLKLLPSTCHAAAMNRQRWATQIQEKLIKLDLGHTYPCPVTVDVLDQVKAKVGQVHVHLIITMWHKSIFSSAV